MSDSAIQMEASVVPRGEESAMIRAVGLSKIYPAAATGRRGEVVLFRGLDLAVLPGEMVAIVGESGAGKSTLLHLLAVLDRPSEGEVWLGERRVDGLSASDAAAFRNREIGYVWQFHYLLPEFSTVENVALPLLARGVSRSKAIEQAHHALGEVGLGERAEHRSGELSGGEQQRVSLARALVTQPKVLLADEPTGDLDIHTAEVIFALIQRLHANNQLTSVLVTHNLQMAARADRILTLRGGRLV